MKKHFTVTYDISKLSDDEQKSLFAEAQSLFQSGKAVSAGWDGGWISVDECIPPERERAITWDGWRVSIQIVESWFAEGGELCVGFEDSDITHWMPLPQPPKGD